jgi:hypothetical protein
MKDVWLMSVLPLPVTRTMIQMMKTLLDMTQSRLACHPQAQIRGSGGWTMASQQDLLFNLHTRV